MQQQTKNKNSFSSGFSKALKGFGTAVPTIIGVILLFGLFRVFVPQSWILSVFTGNLFRDTLYGALIGSISAGNPVNSYIIGGELLHDSVSLYAVTAFIVSWVTVGFIQLPAEASLLGKRFALTRNLLSLVLAFFVAIATVLTMSLL